ncbi:MAG: VCBS repeat-containing protein [Cyclobacteriaceae bacterium]
MFLSRGYQSSVPNQLSFGVAQEQGVKKIQVIWPDGKVSIQENVKANNLVILKYAEAKEKTEGSIKRDSFFEEVDPSALNLGYKHNENEFNDFSLQVLLPQKQSQQGPAIEVGDLNGDGLTDIFLAGGKDQPAEVYLQKSGRNFEKTDQWLLEGDSKFEDNGAHLFDADNDGDLDLYVTSGGYELEETSDLLLDRLYLNDGTGKFTKRGKLPSIVSASKSVVSLDYDADGDLDLIVGAHVVPGKYPLAAKSFVLENVQGVFTDVTESVSIGLQDVGIVNDMVMTDFDGDNDSDLIVVGEWMPITLLENRNGQLVKRNDTTLSNMSGWWNTISAIDFDLDGDEDYFIGNLGGNNKFHPSKESPLHIFGNNLDEDGKYDMLLSKQYNGNLVPIRGKECSTEQNPFVSDKITSYKEFAASSLMDIYGEETLMASFHKTANEFRSVYLENKGAGEFSMKYLPNQAQLGPIRSFAFVDVNKDGHLDVLGVGAIHEAEVETVRYDGNVGFVLLGDSKGGMRSHSDPNFYNDLNARDMEVLMIGNKQFVVVANNDAELKVFQLN